VRRTHDGFEVERLSRTGRCGVPVTPPSDVARYGLSYR
jgi:hypothetical protein